MILSAASSTGNAGAAGTRFDFALAGTEVEAAYGAGLRVLDASGMKREGYPRSSAAVTILLIAKFRARRDLGESGPQRSALLPGARQNPPTLPPFAIPRCSSLQY